MNLKKIGKLLTSKSVWTGLLSCEKRTYRAAVTRMLRNTDLKYLLVKGYEVKVKFTL